MSPLEPALISQATKFLSPSQKSLVNDTSLVCKLLKKNSISDYSFLVAPIAKAYEGYLKEFFLQLGIIDRNNYNSDRFRVGKTLNPSLRYKRFSIFQKLADLDPEGESLAEILWDAWKHGRNEIFHYFPSNVNNLSEKDAVGRINQILEAIAKSGQFLQKHKNDLYF
jgi:hypothetical protein